MTYINIPKPGAQSYTNQNNFAGKQQYDESDILYDQSNVFYDSVNSEQYISVIRPTEGYDIPWNQMTMIWSNALLTWGDSGQYINILKPTV